MTMLEEREILQTGSQWKCHLYKVKKHTVLTVLRLDNIMLQIL
jgi:hypothetical protein